MGWVLDDPRYSLLYDPGSFDGRRCRDGGHVEEELHANAEAQRSGWKGARLCKRFHS